MALSAFFENLRARGERGGRGGSVLGTPSMRNEGERGPPRAAMAMAPGARGELCSGREEEGRGLGRVEEGTGVLTVEAIEL